MQSDSQQVFKILAKNQVTCPSCVYRDFEVSRGRFVLWDQQGEQADKGFVTLQLKVRASGNCAVVRDCSQTRNIALETIPMHTEGGLESSRYLLGDREAIVDYFRQLREDIDRESLLDQHDKSFAGEHVAPVKKLIEDKMTESEGLKGEETENEASENGATSSASSAALGDTESGEVYAKTSSGSFYVSPKKRSALKAQFPTVSRIPNHMKRPTRLRYYYQATDGPDIYLSELDSKILLAAFGSYDKFPLRMTVPVEAFGNVKVTKEMRREPEYEHLASDTNIVIVEVDWERSDIVPAEVLVTFIDSISDRRERREKKKRTERAAQKKLQQRQLRQYEEEDYYDDYYDDAYDNEYQTSGGLPPLDLFDCVTKAGRRR